jgi:hypothetical protein
LPQNATDCNYAVRTEQPWLAQPDLSSLKQALGRFLDLLENDLTRFIGCHLSDPQRRVLQQARLRQAQLR